MSAQAGVLYGRITKGSVIAERDGSGTFQLVAYGHPMTIHAEKHNMPSVGQEGLKVRAMCSDASGRHTLIDLEVVPEPGLDDRQGMFAMSLYKKTSDGKVAKFEMSRGAIPKDGDVDAFVKFIDKASNIAGVKALGYDDEE